MTNQCHDITVMPQVGLAAGACSGNGILLDIHDPVHPVRLDDASDKNFAYWHSATFNNDGTKVLFTDEWGGGTRPRCRATDLPTWGADAVFDIVDTKDGKKLRFGGYYKMPAAQSDTENCVAHNGALIPVPGRDIMAFADGRLWVAGLSNEEFASKLRAIPYPFATVDRGVSVEIYHGNHKAVETRSPVNAFVPYTINNQQHLIAGYTCTPLVKFPIADLKAGDKVRGTTIAEFGAGNRVLDMRLRGVRFL